MAGLLKLTLKLILNKEDFFDVLLTLHLSIFISVINQLVTQNFCFTVSKCTRRPPIGVMIPEAV